MRARIVTSALECLSIILIARFVIEDHYSTSSLVKGMLGLAFAFWFLESGLRDFRKTAEKEAAQACDDVDSRLKKPFPLQLAAAMFVAACLSAYWSYLGVRHLLDGDVVKCLFNLIGAGIALWVLLKSFKKPA